MSKPTSTENHNISWFSPRSEFRGSDIEIGILTEQGYNNHDFHYMTMHRGGVEAVKHIIHPDELIILGEWMAEQGRLAMAKRETKRKKK